MKWFDRWFARKVKWAWDHGRYLVEEDEVYSLSNAKSTRPSRSPPAPNARVTSHLTIYHADGGYVLEYYRQDREKESDGPSLVLVPNDQDLAQAITHVITLGTLRA